MLLTIVYTCIALSIISLLIMIELIVKLKISLPKRLHEPALCDLLDYATLVSDNIIALKSGALMSLFKIEIPDLSTQSEHKINHIYGIVQKALLKLNGSYCVQFDIVRKQNHDYLPSLPTNYSVNTIVKDLEEQRAKLFKEQGNFTSDLILTITWIGNSKSNEQLAKLITDRSQSYACKQIIENFMLSCTNVIDTLELCFEVEPLTFHIKDLQNHNIITSKALDLYQQSIKLQKSEKTPKTIASTDHVKHKNTNKTLLNLKELLHLKLHKQESENQEDLNQDQHQELMLNQNSQLKLKDHDFYTQIEVKDKDQISAQQFFNSYLNDLDPNVTQEEPNKGESQLSEQDRLHQKALRLSQNRKQQEKLEQQRQNSSTSNYGYSNVYSNEPDGKSDKTKERTTLTLNKGGIENSQVEHLNAQPKPRANNLEKTKTKEAKLDSQPQNQGGEPSVEKGETIQTQKLKQNNQKFEPLAGEPQNQNAPAINFNFVYIKQKLSELKSPFNQQVIVHEGLTFIHQCLTGKKHDIAYPKARTFLDSVLSTEDFRHGFTPQIGNQHICVLALEGLPPCSVQGILNALGTLPYTYRFNTRFIYFDNLKSTLLLEKYRRYWAQKSKGLFAQIFNLENVRLNQNALDQMQEIDEAKRALDHNEVVFGAYTANIILMEKDLDLLNFKAEQIIKVIESLGLSARIENVNATEAFLGTLPGHYHENLRRPIVSQDVLSDLLPLSLPDHGERYSPNPYYGVNASPLMQVRAQGKGNYLLNLHHQDLANTLVIGPPGSGKSVLLGTLMLNLLRYPQMRLFTFDKGYSFYALTKALGGGHIQFDNSKTSLCPLAYLENEQDFDYAMSFIETLAGLNNVKLTAQEKNEVFECLQILASSKRRSLSDLNLILTSNRIKEVIEQYTRINQDHCLLDASSNMSLDHMITTFECSQLFKSNKNFSIPVLKQIFHLIERKFDGRPAAIILDEAWIMLQDNTFSAELLKWFKTLRKFNVLVILATQSLSDLKNSQSFENLLDCVKTRFYLANYDATSENLSQIYQQMGLNDKEIQIIAQATPKQDYLFVKNERHIVFNLMLSQAELALLSFSGDHCVAQVDQLYQQYGAQFYNYCSNQQTKRHLQ